MTGQLSGSFLPFSCMWIPIVPFSSSGATHRDIQGSPMTKPASSPALPVPLSFSFCSLTPCLTLWLLPPTEALKPVVRLPQTQVQVAGQIFPACMGDGSKDFVGSFARRQFEAHLCAGSAECGEWAQTGMKQRDQSEKTADPVLCSLSWITPNYFPAFSLLILTPVFINKDSVTWFIRAKMASHSGSEIGTINSFLPILHSHTHYPYWALCFFTVSGQKEILFSKLSLSHPFLEKPGIPFWTSLSWGDTWNNALSNLIWQLKARH